MFVVAMSFLNHVVDHIFLIQYRTSAIITRSWFETALDYKPRILGLIFLVYVLKWYVILISFALKNGVKNIQTEGYNGACTVFDFESSKISNFGVDAYTQDRNVWGGNQDNHHFDPSLLTNKLWLVFMGSQKDFFLIFFSIRSEDLLYNL